MLFQKNLQDLIKFSKCAGDPQSFLSSSLAEIKSEIKSQDIRVKTSALLKLYFVPQPLNPPFLIFFSSKWRISIFVGLILISFN